MASTTQIVGTPTIASTQLQSASDFKMVGGVPSCLLAGSGGVLNLSDRARQTGWNVVTIPTVEDALARLERMRFSWVVIDLLAKGDWKRVARAAANSGQGLLTVFGSPDSGFKDEKWARQLGVWFYFPGVPGDREFESICSQAKDVVSPQVMS